MAFFNNPISPLLLPFLFATLFVVTTATYSSIASPPSLSASPSASSSPSPSPSPSPVSAEADIFYPFEEVSIPKDEQAKDAQYLETNMAKAADKLETFVGDVVLKRLSDSSVDDSTKECLSICSEVYENAADALKKGLEDVNALDFLKANIDVSAFTTNIDTCEECLVNVDDPELSKFKEWVKGVGNDCLDKIAKYSTTINNFD